METKEIKTTYRNIEISYDEFKDKWFFNLRGRDRSTANLMNAKKAIDAPPPKEEKPFKRFEAWYKNYSEIVSANITSMTESGRFWVSYPGRHGKNERTQASHYELFARSPENDAIVTRIWNQKAEINRLSKQLEETHKELRNIERKDWEQTE